MLPVTSVYTLISKVQRPTQMMKKKKFFFLQIILYQFFYCLFLSEPFVDIGADSDTGASDHQTPTKNSDDIQLKSFEDEKQFIALMELANGVSMEEMDARSKFFDMNKTSSKYILIRMFFQKSNRLIGLLLLNHSLHSYVCMYACVKAMYLGNGQ